MARRILNMRKAKNVLRSFGSILLLVTMCYASFIPRMYGVPVLGILFTALVLSFVAEAFLENLGEVLKDTEDVKRVIEALLKVMTRKL